jgi:signal transduction histidine kinase/ActR/RegA family two-component response regulator
MTLEETAPDTRVLIVPPTRRDGEVTCEILKRVGVQCTVCNDAISLAGEIKDGVGVLLITDALAADSRATAITAALSNQPTWSDTPTILLSRTDRESSAVKRLVAALTNVTILDRPTSPRTLVSAVKTAIRGRLRQYQLRDQLRALQEAEDALLNADRRKDEFLAMLAHELRNPLAPIRSSSEMLALTLPPQAPARAAVNVIKRQVVHLTRLVDDLLDVSRITQGRIQLRRQPVELSSIVAQAMESVEPLARQKHHQVTICSDSEPSYVEGDSARLIQCVTNLLTNAVKYTDQDGQIHVETRNMHTETVITVSDNGTGIAEDLMPRIFELFVQSARSLDRSEGGLGIGLSVVKRLIEMHGGSVAASSPGPGCGSTFEIRLPRIEWGSDSEDAPKRTAWLPQRILVVDDNKDAADSLADILQFDGHTLHTAYTAGAALDSLSTFQPSVILLDLGLPDMNGYQVAKRIRDSDISVRIIALTGYGQAEDMEQTRAAGFDAHLVKPVDLEMLERAIGGEEMEVRSP